MEAFEFYTDFSDTEYPEDCVKIWDYINTKGKVNFPKSSLPDYYHSFSNTYYSAGWLHVCNEVLEEFVYWLSQQEYIEDENLC